MSHKVQTQAKAKASTSITPATGQFQPRLFGSEQQIEAHAATHNATEGDDTLRLGHNFGELDVKAEALRPKGDGRRLPEPVRQKMETALGADFSDVRVHEGPEARTLGIQAYTQGNQISFATGEYRPETTTGQALIGHELVHVKQQRAGRLRGTTGRGTIQVDPRLEGEADDRGTQAATGQQARSRGFDIPVTQTRGNTAAGAPIQPRLPNWLRRLLGQEPPHGAAGGAGAGAAAPTLPPDVRPYAPEEIGGGSSSSVPAEREMHQYLGGGTEALMEASGSGESALSADHPVGTPQSTNRPGLTNQQKLERILQSPYFTPRHAVGMPMDPMIVSLMGHEDASDWLENIPEERLDQLAPVLWRQTMLSAYSS